MRTLTDLDGSYLPHGTYVDVYNEDSPQQPEPNGIFDYTPSDTHFDEVMVYYHMTQFRKYLNTLDDLSIVGKVVDLHPLNQYRFCLIVS
jgi:hypothetical protein